jgi:hypothetical protein
MCCWFAKLLKKRKRKIKMKADVVAAAMSAIQSGQAQVVSDQLGLVYDAGLAAAPVGGGLSQSDVDAAVAAARAVDAQALADAQAKSDAALLDLQGKLDAMTAKDVDAEAKVKAIQDAAAAYQAAVAAVLALVPAAAPAA